MSPMPLPNTGSFQPQGWWVFEKYDGIRYLIYLLRIRSFPLLICDISVNIIQMCRAIWHPKRREFMSKYGKTYNMPSWAVSSLIHMLVPSRHSPFSPCFEIIFRLFRCIYRLQKCHIRKEVPRIGYVWMASFGSDLIL